MAIVKTVLIGLTAATMTVLVHGQTDSLISANCMGCLCEASTSCNATSPCHTPPGGGYFCGPFLISFPYWADAGKPVLKGDDPNVKGAFENCVLDLYCAAETVRQYMKKFSSGDAGVSADCNGDGVVNCVDFAYMHMLGGFGCHDSSMLSTDFFKRFDNCWKVVKAASVSTEN